MFKGVCFKSLLIFVFILKLEGASILEKSIEDEKTDYHICSRLERYFEKIVSVYNETYLEPVSRFCWKIPPTCTSYREAIREVNNTISVPKTKTVFECCADYVDKNGTCSAVCPYGCINGKCTKPKTCVCDSGWQGPDCTVECDDGWYGEGCKMYCTCQNGATCDKKNGFCHCLPGFVGTFCESVCPQDSYGKNCENQCHCENGGVCSLSDKKCQCPPGYVGDFCETLCQDGTYGDRCLSNCSCNDLATIFCSHIDGKCMCVHGWKGDACSSKCDLNTWGAKCANECECPPNAVCDHVTGNCSCQSGWYGTLCEKKCSEGYFGEDCKKKCPDCMYLSGTCHHITGQCSCPPGVRGFNCDLECPVNKYGENCNYECSCRNDTSICDPSDGFCVCLPGWIGENCSTPCTNGTYGLNCNLSCNCSNNYTCNPINGECTCEDSEVTECSRYKDLIFQSTYIGLSWDFLIILLVACVLLGIVLFFSFSFCITKRTKKSRKRQKKEEDSTTNVMQDNNSPSISSFHFMNPNYDTTGTTEALNGNSKFSFSYEKSFTDEMKENEYNLPEKDFSIPECDTTSSLQQPNTEIIFRSEETKDGEGKKSIPEVRYSKGVVEALPSHRNSIYADVAYRNEDNSEISQNPPEKKAA